METLLYSIIEFLAQPKIITFFLLVIFILIMFRMTGAEKIWNEKLKEAEKDELEKKKIRLELTKTENQILAEEQKTQELNKPSVVYIKENNTNHEFALLCLSILLCISLVFNYIQYQEIQQYKEILEPLNKIDTIFQQFLK